MVPLDFFAARFLAAGFFAADFLVPLRDAFLALTFCEATALNATGSTLTIKIAGTLPTKLPEGKLGDSLSYGIPRVESDGASS